MPKGGRRIVILGAGFGGLTTAVRVAKLASSRDEILLIDRSDVFVYTPWLYEVITGFLFDDSKARSKELMSKAGIPIKKICERFKHLRFRKATVKSVDFSEKHVVLESGKTVRYDKLVLALGSDISYFGIEGLKKHGSFVSKFDQLEDVRKELVTCFKRVDEGGRCHVVIAGAGASGTETAAELANYTHRLERTRDFNIDQCRITLIDAAPNVLGRFPEKLTRWSRHRLNALGVDVWTDTVLTEVSATHATVAPRIPKANEPPLNSPLEAETPLKYDLLIWAGGVKPNLAVDDFALPKDARGRVKTLPTLQVDGHPDVFAIGDIISFKQGERFAPAAAWAAVDESKVVAHNLIRPSMRSFTLPRHFPAVVNVGGKYAIASVGGFSFRGVPAYILRRLVDLNFFLKILPLRDALSHWRVTVKLFAQND